MKKKPINGLTEAQILLQTHLRELGCKHTPLELQFCNDRKWRFDVADIDRKWGFECNGHWNGAHGAGWSQGSEKMNVAQALGWKVFVFHNRDVLNGKAKEWVKTHLLGAK